MKTVKLFFVVAMFIASQISYAQSKSYKMYDTFSNKDGISNFSFSKNMIDAIDIDFGDDDDQKVTGDLHQIRFMSYNPKKGNMSGPEFTERAIKLLPSSYKKYVDQDDEDSDAIIYLLGSRKKYSECHVFITNERDNQLRMVISFYGDFTVNDLDGLKKAGRNFSDD